jgi:hypothetical protein
MRDMTAHVLFSCTGVEEQLNLSCSFKMPWCTPGFTSVLLQSELRNSEEYAKR